MTITRITALDSGGSNREALHSTSNALHTTNRGNTAASVDVNAAVAANVEAAVAAATNLRLMGYSCRESDGSPAVATFRIFHGATVAGGTAVVVIELAANASETVWFGPDGIDMASGISVDHIAGTFDVNLFHSTIA